MSLVAFISMVTSMPMSRVIPSAPSWMSISRVTLPAVWVAVAMVSSTFFISVSRSMAFWQPVIRPTTITKHRISATVFFIGISSVPF